MLVAVAVASGCPTGCGPYSPSTLWTSRPPVGRSVRCRRGGRSACRAGRDRRRVGRRCSL